MFVVVLVVIVIVVVFVVVVGRFDCLILSTFPLSHLALSASRTVSRSGHFEESDFEVQNHSPQNGLTWTEFASRKTTDG